MLTVDQKNDFSDMNDPEKAKQETLNIYKDLKLEANVIVSMANYPQLKGDEFVQSQIKIILDNQKEITNLKLSKAKLNAYKMWIFVGE